MPTDTERREVARRLRKTGEELGSAALLWYHIAKALEVRTATDGKTACDMLADLIEPGEPKVKCVAEVKVDGEQLEELAHDAAVELTGIDRDALLALAEGLELRADKLIRAAQHARFSGVGPTMGRARHDAYEWRCIASRIREALGVCCEG